MKRTLLYFTVSIPLTYDDAKMTEEQALDAAQRVAERAIHVALEGRNISPDGTYLDRPRGPSLVRAADGPKAPEGPQKEELKP